MLTGTELTKAVFAAVSEFDPSAVRECSLDVHLADWGQIENNDTASPIRVVDLKVGQGLQLTPIDLRAGIALRPGQFLLAETREKFKLPEDLSGMFTLRSRYARNGLDHSTSLVLRPGWEGHLVLELWNRTQWHSILLKAGEPIGQVHFFRSPAV